MTHLRRWRLALQIGRRDAESRGELSNGDELQRLASFASVDAHDADVGLGGEFDLEQRALGAPVAQSGGQDRRCTWRHRLAVDGRWLVDVRHVASVPSSCHTPVTHQLAGMWLLRLARVLAVLQVSMALDTAPVFAQARPAPQATQHALDELANCRAQNRADAALICPTDTPTATLTVTPTSSPTATSSPTPTDEPSPTATPDTPCWLTDPDLGDPDSGYVVFDDRGAPVPCPTPGPRDEPTMTMTPTSEPTSTLTASSRPPAPVAPQAKVRTVLQTVVVIVTAVPFDTPTPVPMASPVATRTSTRSPTPTRTTTASPTATATPPVAAIAPTRPPAEALPHVAASVPVSWDWGGFFRTVALVVVVLAAFVWLLTRRSVVRWGARPKRDVEDSRSRA